MGKKTSTPATGQAAYHAGPPEIDFFGRHWFKDVPQPMSEAEYGALQQRADAPLFDFTYAADAADAAAQTEE